MSKQHYYYTERTWWLIHIRKACERYNKLKKQDTRQAKELCRAIEEALEETRNIPDTGELRVRAVKMVYFRQSHNYEGAGMVLYVSWRTVQNWCIAFLKLVGKKAGFV